MKEMDLCTQRRHLAEAYYLVYLQEQIRKRKEDDERIHKIKKNKQSAAYNNNVVASTSAGAGAGSSSLTTADTTTTNNNNNSPSLAGSAFEDPRRSFANGGIGHDTLQSDAERVQMAIQSFEGFATVKRPSDVALRKFCNDLYSNSIASNNVPPEVLQCVDTLQWSMGTGEKKGDPEAYLRAKIETALWLYCCDQARPELQAQRAQMGASSSSPSSSVGQETAGTSAAAPSSSSPSPSLGAIGGGCSRKNVRVLVSDFLQRFYANSEDNVKHEVSKCIASGHAPGGSGFFGNGPQHNSSNKSLSNSSSSLAALALQQVVREEWRKLVKTHVQMAFSNKSFDLDSMFLVMKSLTKFQTKVCKDIIDTHVKRVAKHYVNETLPRNSNKSLNFKCKEILQQQQQQQEGPSSQAADTSKAAGTGGRKRKGGVGGNGDEERGFGAGTNQSNKQLKLDISVLPDCDQIRSAVRKRWKEEIKRQDALRTRPDLCMMCARNSKAKDCRFKMCGTCCENARKKLGKACICERHAKKIPQEAAANNNATDSGGGFQQHRSPRDLRNMFPPPPGNRRNATNPIHTNRRQQQRPPEGWNRRPRRNAIFIDGPLPPFVTDGLL
jgi:hypothetical protein